MSGLIRQDEPARNTFRMGGCLVAMGVSGFLLILVLAAVQAAREAGRRNICNNNLKQIGLGLQTYADINKYFPYDALWGQNPHSEFSTANTLQGAYHYPWSVVIIPCMESTPLYNAVNKRLPIWNQSQEYGTGGVRKLTPPAYFGYIRSQELPPFRCPSDATFTGFRDLPGFCMWNNYAGSVGVGFYSAKLKEGSTCDGETTAPLRTRGMFAFSEPAKFSAVRDGTSRTLAVAEVTSTGSAAPTEWNGATYNGRLSDGLAFGTDSDQPVPCDSKNWSLPNSTIPWSPATPLAGGSGQCRAGLRVSPGGTRLPMVFRASMVALTESVTRTGSCSLPNTYSSAQGGACGQSSGANAVSGFELAGKLGQAAVVGIAPLYNALYSPNSDWPGPDSHHPGVVLAVYTDGHTTTIQERIDFSVWASLNTRAGGEEIDRDD